MSLAALMTLEPGDSFFFPDHRPFNQDDPGLGEAGTRFPPPPHGLAGAVRFAIAQRLGWSGSGDWSEVAAPRGLDLGQELGSGPFEPGELRFGPPLVLDGGTLLYPVPRRLAGRLDRWGDIEDVALVGPGEERVASDIGFEHLPEVRAEKPETFQPLDGWWLSGPALKRVLEGKKPNKTSLRSPSDLIRTRPRVGIAADHAAHKARDGMRYAAAHGAFRTAEEPGRFACRLATTAASALLADDLPAATLVPLGSHGRMALIDRSADIEPPMTVLHDKKRGRVRYTISLLSPGWLEGGPIPTAIEKLDDTVVSATHGRPLILGAWDRDAPQRRRYQRLYPAGSTWFLEAERKAQVQAAKDLAKRLAEPGQGIGEHVEAGFGAAVVGTW